MSNEKFTLPEKPVSNYESILNVRNADLKRALEENPDPEIPEQISFCGENCAECEYYIEKDIEREPHGAGCRGCRTEGGDCDIRICCIMKKIESCSHCSDFPCEMLKQSYIDDGESEETLLSMKEKRDKEETYRNGRIYSYIKWLASGFVFGILAGALTGRIWELTVCGLILGAGIPTILYPPKK